MQKLVWQNANGFELDLTSGNYGITEWEGFSNTGLNIQTQTVPFQDGGVFLDALIEQRELSVTLAIQDNNNLELRYQQRRELISALNPKLGEGYLIYTNDFISKRIKCIPNIPIFETHNSDTAGTPKANLSWVACEPYWEDLEETVVEFDTSEQVTIQNEGDVPAQLEIEFKTGNVTNPSITRVNGSKKIQYNGVLTSDLFINTNQGKKRAETYDIGLKISTYGISFLQIVYSPIHNIYVGLTDSEILTSTDLENWDLALSNATHSFISLVYAEDKDLFAVLSGGGSLTNRKIITSSDGINWTEHYISTFDNYYVQGLKYFPSLEKFYLVADSGEIFYSSDGINWTMEQTLLSFAFCIEYSEDLHMFVVGSYNSLEYSSDGVNWTQVSLDVIIGQILYIKDFGLFIAIGGSKIITSSNGINWTYQTISSEITETLGGLTYSRKMGKAFVVTRNFDNNNGYILSSSDGISWELSEPYEPPINLRGMGSLDYAGLIWLSGLGFTSYRASEGRFEIPVWSGNLAPSKVIYIDEKGYYIGIFVGTLIGTSGRIAKSYDGINWEVIEIDTGLESFDCQDIIYSKFLDCIIVTISSGYSPINYYFLKSSDSEHWTIEQQTYDIYKLVSAENQEKLVGLSATVGTYISTDGVNWTQSSDIGSCKKILYSEKLSIFITYVNNGVLKSSPDGITWTDRIGNSSTAPVYYINDIGLWRNGFVAVGNVSNQLCYSTDGINWTYKINSFDLGYFYYSEFEGALYVTWWTIPFVYKTYNLIDWEIVSGIYFSPIIAYSNTKNQVLFMDGSRILYTGILGMKNLIQNLSNDSDMNLNLALGENIFTLNLADGSFTCSLKYRQKYIGV